MFDTQSTLTCTAAARGIDRSFVLAGDAIVTVDNGKGTHFTYRVQKVEASERWPLAYFVKVLIGPDNGSDYGYLGKLDHETGKVQLTKKSIHAEDATTVKVIRWALALLWAGKPLPAGYSIHHQGYCGRCGRMLTTPESVERGIGPDCWKIMGGN